MRLDASIEKYKKVMAAIAGGKTFEDAIKEHRLAKSTYYNVKKDMAALSKGQSLKTKKRPYNKKATFVDVPLKTPATNVAIVVCQPNQLKDVLAGLQ